MTYTDFRTRYRQEWIDALLRALTNDARLAELADRNDLLEIGRIILHEADRAKHEVTTVEMVLGEAADEEEEPMMLKRQAN
jgi:hypothetical protein